MRVLTFAFLGVLLVAVPSLAEKVDFSKAVILVPPTASALETKAVQVLQEEIQKRTNLRLAVVHQITETREQVIILGLWSHLVASERWDADLLADLPKPAKEGFALVTTKNTAVVAGSDPRGVLYGVGKLLRVAELRKGSLLLPQAFKLVTAPRYLIRGHQLGYRAKTNAYDAWTPEQFDQYIRELALFGANSVEFIPPRTDDAPKSHHMKFKPLEMLQRQAQIAASYGMDVWLWYPNMAKDYSDPSVIRHELAERDSIFRLVQPLHAVFVPGGDPGDLHPDQLFPWLAKVAKVLHKYHPEAKIWVSPQAVRVTNAWLDAFYRQVNKHYPWFGGVVFGPWVKTPLPKIRQRVSSDIPIRRYPDITHSLSCQYPVKDWDLAFALTLGRECTNPRPVAESVIHNALDEYANGSIAYSEGINDDVNKFIWLGLDWDPGTPVIELLREYARFLIHPDVTEGVAQGLLALERNWDGPLLSNTAVDVTLKQWQDMEATAPSCVLRNYRFQLGLLRAYYDAYIRARLIYEKSLETRALAVLERAPDLGSLEAVRRAEAILQKQRTEPVRQDFKQRCWEIADFLFHAIGAQTSVKRYGAAEGRGDYMDHIDDPLNDILWLTGQFQQIRTLTNEKDRLSAIQRTLHRTDPGPGGIYENLGVTSQTRHLGPYPSWQEDPGGLESPRVSFGVSLRGEEWIHTVQAVGFEGKATPLAWANQLTTLYDTPLTLVFRDLDPDASYTLRVAYTGRFQARIALTANGKFSIHPFIQTGQKPIWEFPIPQEATATGKLELTWRAAPGERGAQVAEIWLIRN